MMNIDTLKTGKKTCCWREEADTRDRKSVDMKEL